MIVQPGHEGQPLRLIPDCGRGQPEHEVKTTPYQLRLRRLPTGGDFTKKYVKIANEVAAKLG